MTTFNNNSIRSIRVLLIPRARNPCNTTYRGYPCRTYTIPYYITRRGVSYCPITMIIVLLWFTGPVPPACAQLDCLTNRSLIDHKNHLLQLGWNLGAIVQKSRITRFLDLLPKEQIRWTVSTGTAWTTTVAGGREGESGDQIEQDWHPRTCRGEGEPLATPIDGGAAHVQQITASVHDI
jgi:hypothetical protein